MKALRCDNARSKELWGSGMLPAMQVRQEGTWRQAGGALDVELHAWRWASDAHGGGSWERSCWWRPRAGASCY